MNIVPPAENVKSRYHRFAYLFVLESLKRAQRQSGRPESMEEDQHVSGKELLNGFRELAYEQFGGMALTVFRQWRIVYCFHCDVYARLLRLPVSPAEPTCDGPIDEKRFPNDISSRKFSPAA